MRITTLKVRIGTRTQELVDCSDDNPDVKVLIKHATQLRAVIDVTVAMTEETAGALGRLVFHERVTEPVSTTVTTEMIPALSRRLDALELSVRSLHVLQNADFDFVWQVAEKSEGQVRMLRNSGNMTTKEIKAVVLDAYGLGWGMDLSSIMDQLTQPT